MANNGDPPTPTPWIFYVKSTVGVAKEMMFMDSAASGETPCVTNLRLGPASRGHSLPRKTTAKNMTKRVPQKDVNR